MLRFSLAVFVLLTSLFHLAVAAETKKVVFFGADRDTITRIQSGAPQAKVVSVNENTIEQEIGDADGFIGTPYRMKQGLLETAKKLKWVQSPSAGVENYPLDEFHRRQITLTNAKITMGPQIADHALALLLALTRQLNYYIPARTQERFGRPTASVPPAIELRGKTAVVIGVGGIGTQIAERAHAFGMRVIGVDPKDVPYLSAVEKVVPPDQLNAVLPEADVVFVSAPHTKQSEGMVGRPQFELMKKGAYFIAVSRGKVYDMNALVSSLDSRKLSGAGVDVTNPEPLPKGHPLWKFDNAIITPHMASGSDQRDNRIDDVIADNVRRFVEGLPLRNVVDTEKGY